MSPTSDGRHPSDRESPARRWLKSWLTLLSKWARVPVKETVDLQPISDEQLISLKTFYRRPKFFIIGYPRSGTTLLARLIRLHPEVHCNWQAHFFSQSGSLAQTIPTRDLSQWISRGNNRWTQSPEELGSVFRAITDYVLESEAAIEGKDIVGDKSPDEAWSVNLEMLRCIYPDALVINIVRDGRDVAISRRIQQFIDLADSLTRQDRRRQRAWEQGAANEPSSRSSMFTRTWLAREAARWSFEVQQTDRWARANLGDRYRAITFEELLDLPIQSMSEIWRSLGVKEIPQDLGAAIEGEMVQNPAADWHAKIAPETVSGLPRGTPGVWRSVFSDEDQSIFLKAAVDGLNYWNYPKA